MMRVALPCRVRDPDRKGKVESGVGHTQKTPLQGQRFESVEALVAQMGRDVEEARRLCANFSPPHP